MPVPRLPLGGVRVLEAGPLPAGTIAGALLGDFGCDVIRLNKPGGDDPMHAWWGGPYTKDGVSLVHKVQNRNKRMATLDLSNPASQPVFERLVKASDVLLENFRPGTMEEWGYDWETLRTWNPRLVFCRISAFGQTGPYAARGGEGRVAEAFGGHAHINGEPDGAPLHSQFDMGGSLVGSWAAMGVVFALYWRDVQGGTGQVIDVGAYEPIYRQIQQHITNFARSGRPELRAGNRKAFGAAFVASHTTGDGRYFTYSAATRATMLDQMRAMGLDQDTRFPDIAAADQRKDEYHAAAKAWMADRSLTEVVAAFDRFEAAGTPNMNAKDLIDDPHILERGLVVAVDDPELGRLRMPGVVPKFSATPGEVRHAGAALDAHNDEVFRDLLGLDERELAALGAAGVI